MKFRLNYWWVPIYIGTASAFTSDFSRIPHNNLQPKSTPKSLKVPIATKVSLEDLFSSHKQSMKLSARMSPQPPEDFPRVDEQLELDLMDSERRVMLYEQEVLMLREQIDVKEIELLEEQNEFRDEKRTLMKRIADFTSILKSRDEELEDALKQDRNADVDLAKQAELENTIKSLESELKEKTDSLESEKESSKELRKKIDGAQDALEYEQMNFEKEKSLLQELVVNERKQVKNLQERFEENNRSFEITREGLLNKIKDEEQKLSDTKTKWKTTQEQLRQVEDKLEIAIQEKSNLLKENELDTEKVAMSDEIVSLKSQIINQQAEMERIKSELERESTESSVNTLETKIDTEERSIKELQQILSEEQTKYEAEKSMLDQKIISVTANLADVETELANERANFSKEKEVLEEKLANEIRVGRLKKKQMKKRYDEIRREMTDIWQSSRRQARQEESRLRKKYTKKIETVQAQVVKLESDLKSEKKRLQLELEDIQSRHVEELHSRDATILELEGSVVTLEKLIVDKDQIIKEKDQRIQQYETSLRQVAKLGLRVTGRKIKNVARPLKRLIQNSPPVDEI